jgi:transposase InsO family protein
MSETGNYDDTAVIETFFKTIKPERRWQRPRRTPRSVKIVVFEYFNDFHNRRLHSARGRTSPLAFEGKAAQPKNRSRRNTRQI